MNERIKEFAEQANIEFIYDPTEIPMRAFAECWEDELEKFAELIIRECAGVTLDYKNGDHYAGWCDHAEEILKHFGVDV